MHLLFSAGVFRLFRSSVIYKSPWVHWIWLTPSSLTPGMNIFSLLTEYSPAQNQLLLSRMRCGVTSFQLTSTPCFAQTSKQLAGRAARQEAHLPLTSLTEPNQVLWAQEVPRKCSCLSGRLWSLRRWDQSTTSPSQEVSILPSPPLSTNNFEPDSWMCVCSPLPIASLELWQGSWNGFRVRVFNRRWVKKIDWANLRI